MSGFPGNPDELSGAYGPPGSAADETEGHDCPHFVRSSVSLSLEIGGRCVGLCSDCLETLKKDIGLIECDEHRAGEIDRLTERIGALEMDLRAFREALSVDAIVAALDRHQKKAATW